MRTSMLVLLLPALLAACSTVEKGAGPHAEPDWVSGPSSRYGDALYLLGRGQAPSQDLAADRARADLAKTIEVQVEEKSRDVVSASRRDAQGRVETSLSQEAGRDITTTTRQVIRGAKVVDLWRDPESKTYHALAVLNRANAAADLRDDIRRHDELTRAAVARARDSDDLLGKIGAAQKAVDEQRRRTGLDRVLRVVGRGGQIIPPPWDLGRLEAELADLRQRLKIRVQADDGALGSAVAGGLSAAGFMAQDAEAADYTLRAQLEKTPVERRAGWYWRRATLRLELVDRGGNVRGTARWPLKVSAQEAATLDQRLMGLAESTLKQELGPVILGFAR